MNQNHEMLERMMETGDGSISRKDALANGVPPASFARYVRSHHLFRISQGVYAKEGAVDELFQWQRRYPRIVYSGITALYLLGLTEDTGFYRFHDVERLQGEKEKHRPLCRKSH